MKTKTFKRLAAAVAAITMMCAVPMMSMPVNIISAAADKTITINATSDGITRKYDIYQIFTGDTSGTAPNIVLSNISWGTGVNSSSLINALKIASADSNSKLSGKFESLSNNPSASDIANKLVGLTDDEMQEFSRIAQICKNISFGNVTVSSQNGSGTINVDSGYYLILDITDATNLGSIGAKSANMIKVVEPQTVTPKVNSPTLTKRFSDGSKANTASIGDTISYKLSSNVPDMTGYNKYFFVVNDKLSPGLELGSPSSFTVTIHDSGNSRSDQTLTNQTVAQNKYSAQGFYVETYKTTYSGDNTSQYNNAFRLVINDLKALQARAGDEIIITYSAYLGGQNGQYAADVKYGTAAAAANTNAANLIYSNDPNHTYTGTPQNGGNPSKPYEPPMDDNGPGTDTPDDPTDDIPKNDDPSSKTPTDTVVTYTTKLNVLKVTGSPETNLPGAKFKLYSDSTCTNELTKYGEQTSATDGTLSFDGLGAGTYYLKETEAPAGYNLLTSPLKITIDADLTTTQGTCTWSYKNGETAYTEPLKITNNAGTTLPSTGGIGTTIFYVSGGALILGAGIVLVTKKRMSLKDDK